MCSQIRWTGPKVARYYKRAKKVWRQSVGKCWVVGDEPHAAADCGKLCILTGSK